jgi:hypothetical protein
VRVVVLDLFGGQSIDIAGPIGQIVVKRHTECANQWTPRILKAAAYSETFLAGKVTNNPSAV